LIIKIEKFGGIIPRVVDPFALPPENAQQAINCRFDLGGIAPYAEDDVIDDLYATGTVTLANTNLSLVNGSAFFDASGPNLKYPRRKLTLTDSAGKKAIGYIGSEGIGETLDTNKLTNGDFTSDASSWSATDCTLASSSNACVMTRTGGTSQKADQVVGALTVGALFEGSIYIKTGSSGAELAEVLFKNGSTSFSKTLLTTGSYVKLFIRGVIDVAGNWGFEFYKTTATAGTMLFDTASLRQVLTPSATGVTITSTPGGTTQNWTSIESGFNYNDSGGYTYEISPVIESMYKYYNSVEDAFLLFSGDVNVVKAPLLGDIFNRVFYTEDGLLKVTDETLFNTTGSQLIGAWVNGSPGYDTLTSLLKDITSAINTAGTSESAYNISSALVSGRTYQLVANLTLNSGQAPTLSFTYPTTSQLLVEGLNVIPFTATSVVTTITMLNTLASNWECKFDLYATLDLNYPLAYRYPSPPAPTSVPIATPVSSVGKVHTLDITVAACVESNGTYNLVFSGGGGSSAAGTYTVLSNIITAVNLTVQGSGYTSAPTVETISTTGTIKAGVGDITLQETRGWVYTFVNKYGEEGPPSLVSNLVDVYDGDTVALSAIASTGFSALYELTGINIYRLNQSLTGSQFQFVERILINATTYSDSKLDAALGELLVTDEWESPPSGAKGLIALPNGILACYSGNTLCLTPPNYPHAWPPSYQKAVDRDIMGLGSVGTTIIVLTEGQPYGVVCSDPLNAVMERIDGGLSNMSKRSVVQVETAGIVAYASPEGIMTIGQSGAKLVTDVIMTREDWNERYNPSTINAYYWQGKYIGFYTNGNVEAGFMLDVSNGNFVDLDFYATAGFHDLTDGKLYLVIDDEVVSFNDSLELREYNWLSKRFIFLPTSFNWIKVVGSTYPIDVEIILRDVPATICLTVTSRKPIRIGKTGIIETIEVRIMGSAQISAIYLSSILEEMPV